MSQDKYMGHIDQAVKFFREGYSCSQAILAAFAPGWGLSSELALKVAASFGGGMARRGDTCGAVTGALMVIGLASASPVAGDRQGKEHTYQLAQEFIERFQSRNGSALCRELLGYDLSKPEEFQLARQENLFAIRCPVLVRSSAEILVEILGAEAAGAVPGG